MYIHIGHDITLLSTWIVAIFDIDRTTADSPDMQNFLLAAEKANRIQWLGPEIPRSVVLTLDRVYLSPVSVETLRSRLDRVYYQQRLGLLREPKRPSDPAQKDGCLRLI